VGMVCCSVLYTLIKSCSTRLIMEVVGEIIWSRKCKYIFCRFSTVSELRLCCFGFLFITVIVAFYEMESIRFNVTCQPISLFAMNERNSASRSIFNNKIKYSFFRTFTIVWWGHVRRGVTATTLRACRLCFNYLCRASTNS
jgi:hypothetical protein